MSLALFVKSLRKDNVLLPALKRHLLKEAELISRRKLSAKDVVIKDAEQTQACFKERAKEYNHRQDLPGEYFHPSRLGVCLRAMFFLEKGAQPESHLNGDDLLRQTLTFEIGTYAHVMVQNLCERAGILLAREVAIRDDSLRILGHGDGILKIDGHKYLLEIKTSNARNFDRLTEAKHAHRQQAHAYMKALNLKAVIILYLNKDTSLMKEFIVYFSEAFYRKEVAERIDFFFNCKRNNELPPAEGDSMYRMPCNYCEVRRLCYNKAATKDFMAGLKKSAVSAKKPLLKFKS